MTSTLHAGAIEQHRAEASPRRTAAGRAVGVGRAVGNFLISAVVVAGLAGFVMALMPLLGWQSVVLATGSMAPNYPTGSLVIERVVPASVLAVGDIVTLTREGKPPVTHRIAAIAPAAGILPSRELTLKGDANDDADPRPYVVTTAGLVVAGFPWGGQVIDFLRSPLALGLITLVIAVLVLRAFWPQADDTDSEEDRG
jgi:signal peptidase I